MMSMNYTLDYGLLDFKSINNLTTWPNILHQPSTHFLNGGIWPQSTEDVKTSLMNKNNIQTRIQNLLSSWAIQGNSTCQSSVHFPALVASPTWPQTHFCSTGGPQPPLGSFLLTSTAFWSQEHKTPQNPLSPVRAAHKWPCFLYAPQGISLLTSHFPMPFLKVLCPFPYLPLNVTSPLSKHHTYKSSSSPATYPTKLLALRTVAGTDRCSTNICGVSK